MDKKFTENYLEKTCMTLLEKYDTLKANYAYNLYLNEENITLEHVLTKQYTILPLNQISNVYYGTNNQLSNRMYFSFSYADATLRFEDVMQEGKKFIRKLKELLK